VGPHKTGTTSIQDGCFHARDALAGRGVLYPPSIPEALFPASHNDVAFLVQRGQWDRIEHYRDQMCAQAAGYDTVLLSGEEFCPLSKSEALPHFLDVFQERFRVSIVYVEREERDRILSLIMHFVTLLPQAVLNKKTLDHFIQRLVAKNRTRLAWFRDRGAIIIPFESLTQGDLVNRFFQAVLGVGFSEICFPAKNTMEDHARSFAVHAGMLPFFGIEGHPDCRSEGTLHDANGAIFQAIKIRARERITDVLRELAEVADA
jgi:hypothetical protein